MKILLVVPYQEVEPYILPNLGLGYIASSLRVHGHEVSYLDCLKESVTPARWGDFLKKGQYEAVGIQMYSYAYLEVKNMFKLAKEALPEVLTFAGGPHPNAIPAQVLKDNPDIDYVFHGEGERSLPKLLAVSQKPVPEQLALIDNLAWRHQGKVMVNKKSYIDDLDDLPSPAWDLMDPRTYPILSHGLLNRGYPIAPIFATRGCPYSCTFCSAQVNMGPKIRKRSPKKIVDEIEMLVKVYGVKEIHFEDDNLTFYRDFAVEVCQEIIERKLKISWACPNGVRLDSLDEPLLKLMGKSGCYSFAVGIESGSDRVLEMMKKSSLNVKIREKIRLIARTTKIRMTGFFMFGFPGETDEDLKQTEDILMTEPLHRIAGGPFVPLPGTRIYNDLVQAKKIPEEYDWSSLSQYDVFESGTLSKQDILDRMRKIHLRFYLRPRIIFGILMELNSFAQVKVAFKMLLYWLGLVKMKKD